MKFLLIFLACGFSSLIFGPFLPYWGLLFLFLLIGGLIEGDGFTSFFAGGLSVGMVWFAVPLWITIKTGSSLPEKIAQIMEMESSLPLMVITAAIGFFLGGLGVLTGNRFRGLFKNEKTVYYD